MKKYSEHVLDYKKSFKDIPDIVKNTDTVFRNKYFSEFSDSRITPNFYPPFISGQIYSFRYNTDSKLSDDRNFINRNPILLFIEKIKHPKYGEITRGLDLITVPPMDKIEILSLIFDEFHSLLKRNSDSYEKKGILEPIPKRDIDKILDKTGSKNSIFGFKNVFISDINILSLEDWFKLPYLKFSAIQGLDIQGIYKRYRN